jgi:hypothetical protein
MSTFCEIKDFLEKHKIGFTFENDVITLHKNGLLPFYSNALSIEPCSPVLRWHNFVPYLRLKRDYTDLSDQTFTLGEKRDTFQFQFTIGRDEIFEKEINYLINKFHPVKNQYNYYDFEFTLNKSELLQLITDLDLKYDPSIVGI